MLMLKKMWYKKHFRVVMLCCLLTAGITRQGMAQSLSNAQALLEPSGTQYFQNEYLSNPAMAGIDSGLHLNAAYHRQMGGVDGAPVTKYFTADGNIGKRVGLGLNVFNDVAGLINRSRVAVSYAYHLPLTDRGQELHFGLSLALNVQRIDYQKLNGDPNDPSVSSFNRRDDYFEGEYGMAYTDKHLTVQAALPNIRGLVKGDNLGADGGVIFITAAAYRFTPEGALSSLTPKVTYRGVRGYKNILDAGVNAGFLDNLLSVMAMYHTTKSLTTGIGVDIRKTVVFQVMYTTQTGGVKTYTDGSLEIGATVNLFR